MQQTIIWNEKHYLDILSKIKKDWLQKLHILADFDRTLTKAFSGWKLRPSLISVLRSEWYLSEEYSKKAYELFDYYNPIEINPNISLEEKKKEMTIWWNKHLDLLVESKLHKSDIEKIIESWVIEFRPWIKRFLKFLSENNIPIIIISANGLGTDSIEMYFEKEWFLTPNVKIISNEFYWDENGNAFGYDKRVIHVFNKDETVLRDFPEIHDLIENKRNVILLWDSLGDPWMIEWFEYDNLLKIWFLNEKEEELLVKYKENYDVILTQDNDAEFISNLFN
jgi:5'-nucleotidase